MDNGVSVMNTEKKSEFLNNYMKRIKTFFTVMLIALFCFFFISQTFFPEERDSVITQCEEFVTDWEQILENRERKSVEVPGKLPAEEGEVIKIVTTLPETIRDGQYICFRTIWQDVAVYVDGECRVEYTTKDTRLFGENSAYRYVFVELSDADAGKELEYHFSSNSKYAGRVEQCYIGDRFSIWLHFTTATGAKTITSFLLLGASLFCCIICLFFKLVYKRELDLSYLSWTVFFCALWMVSEIEFRQLIFRNMSAFANITYWSLIVIPIPLIIYMNSIQNRRYEKIYFIPLTCSAVLFIVGTFLQVLDIVQFVNQLPIIHGLLGTVMLITGATVVIDFFNKRIKDYLSVGIGVCGLFASGIMEIILYYARTSISIGTVLSLGLLFLLAMAIVKTGRDLLENEKKKQQAIMATKAQAQFLANMSHEIRTPINAVIGMNEMILRECTDDTIQEYAHNIENSSNMLLGLVNDVLDFSKIESGQLELVEGEYHLASLIQDEIQLLSARVADKELSTFIEIDEQLPSWLYGDELRIKQIVTNILSNAVKYTKEGSVTLKVGFEWIDDNNINLQFDVEDTGIGIRQEDVAQLFDSFKRLEIDKNRNIEGTGLGLNIAKNLVDNMKGKIRVNSKYGKGSIFIITIPQKVVNKQPMGDYESAVQEYRKSKDMPMTAFVAPEANILAVDDNGMNLSVLKGLLKRSEVRLTCVKSGRECLDITRDKVYDIIFLDHMMPEMDGIETLKLLRGDDSNPNQHTTVIALTANAIAGYREMYLENGFDDFFSKPIKSSKLDEILMQYLPKEKIHILDEECAAGEREAKDESLKKDIVELNGASDEENKKKDVSVMAEVVTSNMEQGNEDALFVIDREIGLSYCGSMVELYQEVIQMFCEQCPESLALLEQHLANQDWKQYAIVAHGMKGNAKNIGAMNFAELCLQHEMAGKEGNGEFITTQYESFKKITEKLLKILAE